MTAQRIEFDAKDVKYIVTNYKKGDGLQTLAEVYGVSMPVIRRVLVENNVTIRGKGRPKGSTNKGS